MHSIQTTPESAIQQARRAIEKGKSFEIMWDEGWDFEGYPFGRYIYSNGETVESSRWTSNPRYRDIWENVNKSKTSADYLFKEIKIPSPTVNMIIFD